MPVKSVFRELLEGDLYSNRIFFFLSAEELPPEGDGLSVISSNLKRILGDFEKFTRSEFWSSFEIFCEPNPIISHVYPTDTPQGAVVQYMKHQKEGNIDGMNSLLIESAKSINENFVREVGKERSSAFMRKIYEKFGDSFTLFSEAKPSDWKARKVIVSIAGQGPTNNWQLSRFTVTEQSNKSYLILPKVEDEKIRSVFDKGCKEILPMWVSELNYKKHIARMPRQ